MWEVVGGGGGLLNKKETDNIMSFREGIYTIYFLKGSKKCLFPEGPKALKEINSFRFLKEINCIFLNKTHDIKFIMNTK